MNRPALFLLLISIFITGLSSAAHTGSLKHQIMQTMDLTQIAATANRTKRPIVLLMSQADCPFCVMIKQDILNPMVLSGDYADRIIMRELMIDSDIEPRGFDGYELDAAIIAGDYAITVTPTLLFLGPDGNELTKRIVGINTPELFSFYVDQAIDEAVNKLKDK